MLRYTLPELPPSLNQIYRNVTFRDGKRGGRVKTKEYSAWLARMLAVIAAPALPITDRVAVEYTFKRPDKRRRDLGNLEKAVSDMLVKAGVIKDDCLIDAITLRWTDREDAAPTEITVEN